MPKYRIYFQTHASTSVELDVPEEITDPEGVMNWAEDQGSLDFPSLCHRCTGGRYGAPSLELGDEWAAARDPEGGLYIEIV